MNDQEIYFLIVSTSLWKIVGMVFDFLHLVLAIYLGCLIIQGEDVDLKDSWICVMFYLGFTEEIFYTEAVQLNDLYFFVEKSCILWMEDTS